MKKQKHRNLGSEENLVSILRKKIALLEYPPGETLRVQEITKEFDCSRTPIREALARLQAEGLINNTHGKGLSVSEVNFRHLKEVSQVRKHLTILVAQLITINVQPPELDDLEKLVEEMKEEEEPGKLIELDLDFHNRVYKLTRNQLLERIMNSLIIKATRIWLFSINRNITFQFSKDHSKLIEALREGNRELVEEVLQNHSQQTIKYIKQDLENI